MDKKEKLIARAKGRGQQTEKMRYEEASIWVYAARYCHHRQTGAAFQVVNSILLHWDEFDPDTQDQLIKEAGGATSNLDDWVKVVNIKAKK